MKKGTARRRCGIPLGVEWWMEASDCWSCYGAIV